MKKLFLFCAVCALALVGCGKDDGDKPTEDGIVGRWQQTHYFGWEKEDGEIVWDEDEPVPASEAMVMEFGKSGTGTIYFDYPDDPADSETFTWTLSGTTLTLITTDDPDETGTYKVERLTSSELVLSMSESGTDDGVAWEYYDRNTFKKLK